MLRILFLAVINILSFNTILSQDINYSVNLIKPELLQNANAVKRLDERKLVIEDIGSATLYHKYAITILNAAGEKYADFYEYYDKLISIKDIDGKLLNADGVKLKSVKKKDVQDIGLSGEFNFVDDSRIKHHNFNNNIYPYTIYYETEIDFKGIFGLPRWIPVEGNNMSVSQSKLIVEAPASYQLRYKEFNLTTPPLTTNKDNITTYEWQVENIPAIEEQEFSLQSYELTPAVFLAPTDFFIEDYKGNMSTWNDLGKFVYSLNYGRDQLPENIKNIIHQLTDSVSDDHKKIRLLYNYLQKNTRYISIQLGIGGWQTFPAEYVAKKGYGDCKALSNYMCALLHEVGIKSYYTLINGGNHVRKVLVDFPSTQFNHIIVCVPVKNDTVWLECTNQTVPMGYMGSFTSNRYALLVDESGGKIVHTPKYDVNDNQQIRKITAIIDESGNLVTKINTSYAGIQQDQIHGAITSLPKEKIEDYLKDKIKLPSFDLINFSFKEDMDKLPVVYENLEINAKNYSRASGKRLFIVPNILTRITKRLTADSARKNDIKLDYDFRDIDSVIIHFPTGYHIESLPLPVKIENKFGKFMATSKISDNTIVYYRTREQFSGIFPANSYNELAKYYNDIYKADNSAIVLIKNE